MLLTWAEFQGINISPALGLDMKLSLMERKKLNTCREAETEGSSISHVQGVVGWCWMLLPWHHCGCFWPRFLQVGFLHLAGDAQLKAKASFHKSATSKFPFLNIFPQYQGFPIIQSQKFWNKFQLSSPVYVPSPNTIIISAQAFFFFGTVFPFLWVNLLIFWVPASAHHFQLLMQSFPD